MRRIRAIAPAVFVISLFLAGAGPAGADVSPSTYSLYFEGQAIGTYSEALTVTLSNATAGEQVLNLSIDGPQVEDYFGYTDCEATLPPGASCDVDVVFSPTGEGQRRAYLFYAGSGDYQHSVQLVGGGGAGYYLVLNTGDAVDRGLAPSLATYRGPFNQPIVGAATTATGKGLWTLARDGGVFSAGDAQFYGSTGGIRLNQPVVGMAATPTGEGYWFVAADGGIFAYGDAGFFGSAGSIPLNQPIVGMAPTPTGEGYWLVARDGGIFSYGDAGFFGSTGGIRLNQPIVGMAPTPTGEGYWFVAADGGIFSYGDARFRGSAAGTASAPVVGMAAAPVGEGYWLALANGEVRNFGAAQAFSGRMIGMREQQAVVAIAPTSRPPA